jgi:hypothetical protein
MQMQAGQEKGLGGSSVDYASYSGCVNGAEVKLEGVYSMAAQNGGSSVLTFSSSSGALQLGGYSLVHVPSGVSNGEGTSLLNSNLGLPPLQLPSDSSSLSQGGLTLPHICLCGGVCVSGGVGKGRRHISLLTNGQQCCILFYSTLKTKNPH